MSLLRWNAMLKKIRVEIVVALRRTDRVGRRSPPSHIGWKSRIDAAQHCHRGIWNSD